MNFRILIFISLITMQLGAQNKFSAAATLGFTAAQLGGDGISGYDKLGMVAGLKLGYPISKKWDLNMDLLYSQRGSRSSFGVGSGVDSLTKLNYIEIPVYITLNDWYVESENYNKVGAFAGLSYGYLISVQSNQRIFDGNEGSFNKTDLSGRIGVYYSFTKSLTFRTYYTDAFLRLYNSEELNNTDSLDSFFWTFRLEYNF